MLAPGKHRIWSMPWTRDAIEIADTLETRFTHPLLDVLVDHPHLRAELVVVDLNDRQRALVWLAPGKLGKGGCMS